MLIKMPLLLEKVITIFLVLFCLCDVTYGQTHKLKVIQQSRSATDPYPYVQVYKSVGAVAAQNEKGMKMDTNKLFEKADRICLYGMVALYNETKYGEGKEASTLVISAKGTDYATCTGSVPALRNVKSLQYLGHEDPSVTAIQIFSDAYFLGITTTLAATDTTARRLGSFAITGENAKVLLCAETGCNAETSICINNSKLNGLYLVRDAAADKVTKWPRIVREVRIEETANYCDQYSQPPYPSSRSLLLKNATILDVHASEPSASNKLCDEE